MSEPKFSWKWKRGHGNAYVVLTKDGKKIGSVKNEWMVPQCSCGPDYNCYGIPESEIPYERVAAYVGGKLIGKFPTVIDAKEAVETALGITTELKKTPQPERIQKKHIPSKNLVMAQRWKGMSNWFIGVCVQEQKEKRIRRTKKGRKKLQEK
jgi:hypothetical protein